MSEARSTEEPRVERRGRAADVGTSWTAVIFGWLTALGAGLILSGIVAAIVGAILGVTGGDSGTVQGGASGLVGLILTLFLAFLIGGYAAGRMAGHRGLKHGLLVPLLSLVITIVLAIIAGAVGSGFIDQLSGVTLPQAAQEAQSQVPRQNLGTILTISGIVALIVPFIGGAIGGPWGARRTIRA